MENIIEEHISVIKSIEIVPIKHVSEKIKECLGNNGKIIWMGNGGSAADCQHLAAEFVGRFERERKPYSSIALTTDTSIITAIGNDYGFNQIFVRQIRALCNKNDVVIGITTSGNSENIIAGLKEAKRIGAYTVIFTGQTGGKASAISDYSIKILSNNTARIQEAHILIGHMICSEIDKIIVVHKQHGFKRIISIFKKWRRSSNR